MASFNPRAKLLDISNKAPQLWTVAYVEKNNAVFCAEKDLNSAMEGGADAIVFINECSSYDNLNSVIKALRPKYPDTKMGVNYLGDPSEPYGYRGTFFLCKEYGLEIAWTDFSGVDLIRERPPISLHDIDAHRPRNVFYCSGIHMKYSSLLDQSKTLIQSAYQAMGWVDGILLTGPITGILPSPDNVRTIRNAIGDYPLGLASGVSCQNAHLIRELVDFCLAGTSLFDKEKRVSRDKVQDLARCLKI